MKRSTQVLLFLLFAGALGGASCAPPQSWEDLHARSLDLARQGRYGEAERLGREGLKVAEKRFGPDHPNTARSLTDLADLYRIHMGKYAEAEPLYKQALAVWEKAQGSDHPEVATLLEKMADLYKKTGRKEETERAEARAKEIRSAKR
jgi:tetratricopeptide (TPR) repeat protein